jgi:hypothetical protein
MKVTNLRRKLIAALVASGMLAPTAACAANLDQNLVVNGGFEHVDLGTPGPENSPLILDWTPSVTTNSAFAYSHDPNTTGVPDYADGDDPPNPGLWYFNSNRPVATYGYIDQPGKFYQDINVAGGNSGSLIATGLGAFSMSAYMSSYHDDADYGNVHAQFRTSSGTVLGSAVVSDSDPGPNNVWNLNSKAGSIPIGTDVVRLSLYGTKDNGIGAGPDGYIDNVEFKVTNLPKLAIVVNRSSGNITLWNLTNSSVPISGYSITSAFEGMTPANWLSIADNYDSGNPGPNQVDATHAWSQLTGAITHTDLSEADLATGLGASLPNSRSVNLGNNSWLQTPHEDLVFQYISGGAVVDGIVAYVGNSNLPFANGDFNLDGAINAFDWTIMRNNQLANLSSLSYAQAYRAGDLTGDKISDHADFIAFKSLYDTANGAGSFAAMLGTIPEPSSIVLVLTAGLFAYPTSRRHSPAEPNRA